MLVRIVRYFSYPDLKRQTPKQSFKWKNFTFTEDEVEECDYLIILDHPKKDVSVKVNCKNIIHFSLEPPNEVSKYRQFANKKSSIIYNQFNTGKNSIQSHGALPWHIDKDYDFLSKVNYKDLKKENVITWVTSNQRSSKGHKKRMDFLDSISSYPFVKLYGRGIKPIKDKWSVLSTSKYTIAYENYKSNFNITEKIMDCFLSYSIPIYYGSDNICNYFPKNSFIKLNENDKYNKLFLEEIVNSNFYEENIEAIKIARDLVLNKYQLFPFLYAQINSIEAINGSFFKEKKENIIIKGGDSYFNNYPISVKIEKEFYKLNNKIKNKF